MLILDVILPRSDCIPCFFDCILCRFDCEQTWGGFFRNSFIRNKEKATTEKKLKCTLCQGHLKID